MVVSGLFDGDSAMGEGKKERKKKEGGVGKLRETDTD